MDSFDDIARELIEKAKACKTSEELLALAKEEGYELSDEQLQDISGGWGDCTEVCKDHCRRDGRPPYFLT